MKTTLEWAYYYRSKGLSVLPLMPKSKKPAINSWKEYQRRYATDEELNKWFGNGSKNNIGIVTGAISGIVVLDLDNEEAIRFADEHHIEKTPYVRTPRGYHLYLRHKNGVRNSQLEQEIDIKGEGGYVVAPPSISAEGIEYVWFEELERKPLAELPKILLTKVDHEKKALRDLYRGVNEGERNDSLAKIIGSLVSDGLSQSECLEFAHKWNSSNSPPLTDKEVEKTVESIFSRHQRKEYRQSRFVDDSIWPDPISPDALHGIAGEFIKTVQAHTESDPVAILIQFLTAFGNVVGTNPHFKVEADHHALKIFAILVGETSKARKGTSWGIVKSALKNIDVKWAGRIKGGLASGEGLVWHIRDEDDGVEEKDKRLLAYESEFATILRIISREGNILSPTIRQAWDDGNLSILTKNSPAEATKAHISIVGHVTIDELRRHLDRTEIANGFANRFIWVCVKRSKILPEGGKIHELDLGHLIKELRDVVNYAKTVGEIKRDEEARELWIDVYGTLSEGKPGLFGAVTSRAEAQVMRLACIYALLERSNIINEKHLRAALALWKYAEDSAKYIFGEASGDPIADTVLKALRKEPRGLNKSELFNLFNRHARKYQIDQALAQLIRSGMIYMISENTAGRPTERYFCKGEKSEI